MLTWTGAALVLALGWNLSEAAPPWGRSKAETATKEGLNQAEAQSDADAKSIRLYYMNSGWDKVLKDLSEEVGMPLVADRVPSSKYTRHDRQKYNLDEAMKILNQDLEKKGFRLIKKGNYLVVVDLPSVRTEYPRPTVGTRNNDESIRGKQEPANSSIQQTSGVERRVKGRNVSHQNPLADDQFEEEESEFPEKESKTPRKLIIREVQLNRSEAVPLARSLYQVFKTRAELVEDGPLGLQAFRVYEFDTHGLRTREVTFTLGIDDRNQALVVEAVPEVARRVSELIELLDRGSQGRKVQPVLTKQDPQEVARTLKPQLEQIAAVSQEPESFAEAEQEVPRKPDVPLNQPDRRDPKDPESTGMEGLKGDVSIESMSDLGVLILKGSQRDVDSVMKIIREIERMSIGATPNVELVMLTHVNSESLSRLLNNVYEKLHATKIRSGPAAANTTSRISSIPVVKPNAILLLAPADEIPNVMKLIEELDQPVPPQTEYQVFRLEHTTPSRVEAMIDKLYSSGTDGNEPPGLATRVRVYGDIRTNSVVVQARPRDLIEVESLIKRLDVAESGPVSQLKIIPMKHANADELAATLRQAIQSVVSPAGSAAGGQNNGFQPGNFQQPGGDFGGSELNEVKSTILQFLSVDQGRPLRSGILSDIRINSDMRTNSLVVSAPEQSLALIEAVVKSLDRPPSAVAEIKVFELARGDATAMAQLLMQIFRSSSDPSGNNAQSQTGVRQIAIAGSESGGTQIPLNVSVDVRTNSIIATGSAEALKVAEAILLRLDQSDIRQRETVVIRLKNSDATQVASAVNEFLVSRRDISQQDTNIVSPFEQIEREVVVVPELGSNSLIISATPRFFDEIKKTVERLDEAPRQVIIQALLVEVGLDNVDEFGIELGLQDSILFRRSAITDMASQLITLEKTTTELGTQTTDQTIVSQSAVPGYNFNDGGPLGNNTNPGLNTGAVGTQGLSNFQLGRVNGDLGYGGFVFSASSESVSVLLRALAGNRRVDILSRPQIRALDNQLAEIFVGQEVPRVNGVIPSSGVGVAATPSIEQKKTGIGLNVTPRITPDRSIVMQISAEKSALSTQGVDLLNNPNGSVIRSPIIDQTVALTTVSVKDGQTIVLGGMITKNDENFERKVPYIGDLPVIGSLFRYDYSRSRRTELLIFLTPRIIATDEDSELIKQIEAERINMIESEAEQIHGPIMAAPPPLVDNFMNSYVEPYPPATYDEDPSIPRTSPNADEIPYLPSEGNEASPPPALPPADYPVQQMGGFEEKTRSKASTEKDGASRVRRMGFSPRRRTTADGK